MDEDQIIDEMVDYLEDNGEIRLSGPGTDISIQTVDDKEGYSYVSSTNVEFDNSRDAIEWAVEQFGDTDEIESWE